MKEKDSRIIAAILASAGLLVFCLYALAGNLEPNAPPGPTMHTQDEIYHAVETASSGISQREDYCQYIQFDTASHNILTVPTGKRFVVLRLYAQMTDDPHAWKLTVNGDTLIDGKVSWDSTFVHDFPDRCVVVEEGETLVGTNTNPYGHPLNLHLIGYFYDAQ
jgi:hypothetical protein